MAHFTTTLFFLALTTSTSAFGYAVVIDPGHGGKDRGTVRHGMAEADIVLDIALKLENEIHQNDPEARTFLTRRTDRFISLEERGALARSSHADALLSLHVNSSPLSRAKGAEFYFQNQLPADEESMYLAARENGEEPREMNLEDSLAPIKAPLPKDHESKLVLEDLVRNARIERSSELVRSLLSSWKWLHKSKSNAVRQAPFFIISNVNMPSALIEIGFLTSAEDADRLRSETYRLDVAKTIYRGLVNFRKVVDSSEHAL
jgi:N-acetylmuramoyl-L-alanine amidase